MLLRAARRPADHRHVPRDSSHPGAFRPHGSVGVQGRDLAIAVTDFTQDFGRVLAEKRRRQPAARRRLGELHRLPGDHATSPTLGCWRDGNHAVVDGDRVGEEISLSAAGASAQGTPAAFKCTRTGAAPFAAERRGERLGEVACVLGCCPAGGRRSASAGIGTPATAQTAACGTGSRRRHRSSRPACGTGGGRDQGHTDPCRPEAARAGRHSA